MAVTAEPGPSAEPTAPPGAAAGEPPFKPFVPASEERTELTLRALVIGSFLGVIFGASSVYLMLKIGITVSASIPVAVLSIPIFRALGGGSILENNLTQTVGSAGESIAFGIAATMPALMIMGYDMDLGRTTLVALTGGWLGVMLMIPLRRSLIVKEHGNLTYPEGTACAEVLEAGERKGTQALYVTIGLGAGIVYKFLYKCLLLWKETPQAVLGWYKNAVVEMEASPELLGVGYVIGPRNAGCMVGGGILSYLVLMPLIRFFGEQVPTAIAPATEPISKLLQPEDLRDAYIFYIGVGAVASAGIISLVRSMPTIVRTFTAAMRGMRAAGVAIGGAVGLRTERDLPVKVTLGGVAIIAVLIAVLPQLHVTPVAALLVIVFGFFFSTVSARVTGQIGSSSNPISGMTIATILLTCVIFIIVGWTGSAYRPIALTIGAIVCVAASNAGATAQDLKTGFLVGSTPRRQQIGLLVGVTTSALCIGWTLYFINGAYTTVVDERVAHPKLYPRIIAPVDAATVDGPDGLAYREARWMGGEGAPAGKVLVDGQGVVAYSINPGISVGGREDVKVDKKGIPIPELDDNGQPKLNDGKPIWQRNKNRLASPKATLMALLIDGALQGTLPWALILFGVFITIVLEVAGVESLAFAVGLYLPLSSSTPIFVGGVIRWLADRRRKSAEGDAGPGILLSSGLIAGGSLCGLLIAGFALKWGEDGMSIPALTGSKLLTDLGNSDLFSTLLFAGLAIFLYIIATRRDSTPTPTPPA